jgi:hypothetical protein
LKTVNFPLLTFPDLFKAGQHVKAAELLTALMKEQNSTDPEVLGALAVCLCQIPSKFVEAEALAKKACYIGNDEAELVMQQVISDHKLFQRFVTLLTFLYFINSLTSLTSIRVMF